MNKRERDILHSLCDGDITFSEAADQLGITEKEIEEMLENYSWLPSPQRLAELNEAEMETLSYIREISQQGVSKVSNTQAEIQFKGFTIIQNTLYPSNFAPIGNVNMNYIESIPNELVLTTGEQNSYAPSEIVKLNTINLSSKDTEVCLIGTSQSINTHFQPKNTQTLKIEIFNNIQGLW
ncbi:hypothetical protein [Candidatus Methanoperedens nitratireducens]|uniref:Uncharacterized protein n=1 Tax=Candidatus Methanoperedens nitratireducens TaxID=1392998 RepID=A0A284VKW5_9EURY|nr:hypothetical protein [Candidatus Methanoperedens nitroreducens]SNQ59905.1 hypothetical protein MNV_1400005 [Candidatus Methanoperedens nitroreducens]